AGETVEIEYYTAGRGHVTRRRVDPLRLEWRGEVVYLIAYCHLRGDRRVFRVDRIQRLV
ncbi:MAG TPA: WYL domain-containing protein, partial [Chloroflexi bacterium]|nr:WYL domain-containing protein [Chloroflexota bacterium]